MAMNKSRTSLGMKILIIALAVVMAASILLGTVFSTLFNQSSTSGNQASTTAATANTVEGIGQQYTSTIAANDAVLKKTPKEFSILVSQGNTYFDWALKVQQTPALATQQAQVPLWLKAAGYYQRALATTKTIDPQVATDMAAALHYGGQNDQAIVTIKKVLKADPTLPQAVLNSAIFYESAEQTTSAVAAYTRYLTIKGVTPDSVTFAKGRLATLQK